MTTDELVDEIFGRCRERIERGEAVDVEEIVRAHPDLAETLRDRFAAARLLDRAGAQGRRHGVDAAALTRVGATLGPYRIESVLGAGGMGTVYLARVEGETGGLAPGDRVAVKVFHPHLVTRERFGERFLREAELGRRVRHPNVVRTLAADHAAEDDRPVRYLVMEHVEGRTLREMLGELGRLPEELVRHVGREVARGLAAIHAAGAVHRDLKPENVIVTQDHVVKVMDLGVARIDAAATLSETGAFVGSLRYAAPEQLGRGVPADLREAGIQSSSDRAAGGAQLDTSTRRGHPAPTAIDARTDLHALGLLLHELATGIHAFDGEDFAEVVRQILDVSPRRCGSLVPQLSPFLEELISQLLEKDRERRPVSAEFVAAILDEGEKSRWWRERAAAIRRETRRPLRRIRIPRETSLHGRDAELTRLRELFDLAKAGDGRAVLVEGEAGIGKSRLVDEFVLSLWGAGEDFDFLFGSYPPGGAASASGAFVTAYREHLGDDEDALRDALPQTPALVPSFAALLRGDAPPAGAEKLTKDSIQALFVRATRSLAARRTTIVLIDDLHFAPEEGRALFTSLALAVPGHRILLLGGARRSVGEKWTTGFARLPNAARIALERLSPKDLVDLLADALRSPHLAEELGGRIAAKSDGNPFFVFEILRGLREGRFLTRRPDGTWITTRSIREIEVPPSIVEVIQARVLDLGVDERNVLEVASCIGFEFDAGLVGAVLRVEPIPLLQRLGRIEKAHRLVRSVGSGFAFDHHQVQEVLYAGLSPPLREAYHAAIGAAVELRSDCGPQHPRELDGALCVDLASHFLRGARGARALKYLDPALTHLEARWLNDAAFELCDLALAAPELLRGTARCEIALRKAARLTVLGRRDVARVALEAALALADATSEPGLRASARCWLGDHLSRVSCHDEAERVLLEAIAISEDTGDRSTLARVEERLGTAYSRWSRFDDAISHVERSLTLAREIGDLEIEALAAGTLGTAFWATGRWTEALTHHEAQLALAQELGDLRLEGYARGNVGTMLHLLGRVAESLDAFERSLSLAKETGDRILEGGATGRLTSEYIHLGRADDAIALARHHLGLAREIGDPREEARATASLGETAFRAGLLGEARARYRTSLELCRRTGWRHGEAGNLNRLVTIERELGSIEAARVHVEELLSLALAMGARSLEASALLARAELDADAGAVSAADRGFTEALVAFREIRSRGDEASTLGARGRHLALQGRVEEARADLESSLAIAREIGDGSATHLAAGWLASLPGSDASLSRFLLDDEARHVAVPVKLDVRFVLWRATGARSHLVDAKRLLDLMVANAPLDCRETMLTNVRLHREILAAWRGPSGDDGAPLRAA